MPANKKYLLSSGWSQASKLIAAIFGGASTTLLLHNLVGVLWSWEIVILSLWFSFPTVWITIMCLTYWIRNPWKIWALLVAVGLAGTGIIYLYR